MGAPQEPRGPEPPAAEPHEPEPSEEARLRQAAAQLNATRERLQREHERERQQLRSQLILELLPVLDNLDRSLDAAQNSPDQALREGVSMVRDQFEHVLRSFGVETIEAEGVRFDPAVHEAVSMAPVAEPALDRTVVDVIRPGYRHNGRLLRAAQVTVGDFRPEQAADASLPA